MISRSIFPQAVGAAAGFAAWRLVARAICESIFGRAECRRRSGSPKAGTQRRSAAAGRRWTPPGSRHTRPSPRSARGPRAPNGRVVRVGFGMRRRLARCRDRSTGRRSTPHPAFRRVGAMVATTTAMPDVPEPAISFRARESRGPAKNAGGIRARGVGTERLVAGEPRRQDLARRPGDVRASGHRDDRRTIDGECERATHGDAIERRHARIEEHAVELRQRPRVELQRHAARAEAPERSGQRAAQRRVGIPGGDLAGLARRIEAEPQRDAVGEPVRLSPPPTTCGSANCPREHDLATRHIAQDPVRAGRRQWARAGADRGERRARPIRTGVRACRGSPDRAR